MAGSSASVTWDLGEIKSGIDKLDRRAGLALDAIMTKKASDAQSHARANAPWTDWTSNARNGLMAQSFRDTGVYGFVLYHSVPYGVWLEVRFAGRYAIILPTIEKVAPETMSLVRNLLGRL